MKRVLLVLVLLATPASAQVASRPAYRPPVDEVQEQLRVQQQEQLRDRMIQQDQLRQDQIGQSLNNQMLQQGSEIQRQLQQLLDRR